MLLKTLNRSFAGLLLTFAATVTHAHTGHGVDGFHEGIVHPFGLDHMLAMLAVGVWSVSALPEHKAWQGPAVFMTALIISAGLAVAGMTVPFLEQLIALSVVLFGAMLATARLKLPAQAGLAIIALAAVFHGLAHGAAAPETGVLGYAAGFLLTTAALHWGGVFTGLSIRCAMPDRELTIRSVLGLSLGSAGFHLLGLI